jgi:uncharacterized protein
MSSAGRTQFGELSREEAVELLGRHQIGRIAFTFHDRVDVEPIGYVFIDGCIYGRTSPGTKLTTVQHHPWVAFEVDEIASRSDWRSVVARGTLYLLDPTRGDHDRDAYDRALAVIRSADPDALTEADSAPHRTHLFRVFVDEIAGRTARPAV